MRAFAIHQQSQAFFKRELSRVGLFELLRESVSHSLKLERAQGLQGLLIRQCDSPSSIECLSRGSFESGDLHRAASGLLIVSRAANVLVNGRWSGVFVGGFRQWLRIESAFEDRAHTRLTHRPQDNGALASRFQALRLVLSGQREQAETGTVSQFRMFA